MRGIVEKPETPPSNYTVTGLYCLNRTAPNNAAQVTPSARGELEITSLLEMYLDEGTLTLETMGEGYAWLDTGNHGSLLDAATSCARWKRGRACRQGALTRSHSAMAGLPRRICRRAPTALPRMTTGAYLRALIR